MNEDEKSLTVFLGGGGRTTVALGETVYFYSRGQWIASVPLARYDEEGNWADGGHVYATFDYAGMMDEAVRWTNASVRAPHES